MKRVTSLFVVAVLAASAPAGLLHADPDRLAINATRYDLDYPVIDYSGPARNNPVWQLQQKLSSGKAKLSWEPRQGYMRSVLQALGINTDSQLLV